MIHDEVFSVAVDALSDKDRSLSQEGRMNAARNQLLEMAAWEYCPSVRGDPKQGGVIRESFKQCIGSTLVHLSFIAEENALSLDECLEAWKENYEAQNKQQPKS